MLKLSDEQLRVLGFMCRGQRLFIKHDYPMRPYMFVGSTVVYLNKPSTFTVLLRNNFIKQALGYTDNFPVYEITEFGGRVYHEERGK